MMKIVIVANRETILLDTKARSSGLYLSAMVVDVFDDVCA